MQKICYITQNYDILSPSIEGIRMTQYHTILFTEKHREIYRHKEILIDLCAYPTNLHMALPQCLKD